MNDSDARNRKYGGKPNNVPLFIPDVFTFHQLLVLRIGLHSNASSQSDSICTYGQNQRQEIEFPDLLVANGIEKEESRNQQADYRKAYSDQSASSLHQCEDPAEKATNRADPKRRV